MTLLPPPSVLLGIDRFEAWYPGQDDLVSQSMDWYYSLSRFLGLSVPTGSGKTLVALLLSHLSGSRTIILTATKGLQAQYSRDISSLGGVLVMGQNNFPCPLVYGLRADEGPCHDGLPCPIKESCPYRTQLAEATRSQLVVTNYAYWLAQTNFAVGLGEIDLLVCDEGHMAFGAMENYLTIFLSKLDIEPVGIHFPEPAGEWGAWRTWAGVAQPLAQENAVRIESEIREYRSQNRQVPNHISRAFRSAKSVASRLERLTSVSEDWVIQKTYHGYRFVPKWVDNYSDHLFHDVPKVVLMSAILSHRAIDYLGVPKGDDRTWIEADSYFPPENTPIWHIPTARINYRTDDFGATIWASRVDQIIQRRLDRKGIVFTVSYERARLLLSRSRFKDIMLTHSTSDVVQVVDKFKAMPAPAVLVSPSVTTGWDFAGETCRYIVVGKIPYPDTQDPVTKARSDDDKDWTSYMAMETLVQECGRATRSSEDRCEVFLIDDNSKWFMYRYSRFAPSWFMQRWRGSMETVPDPLI